MPSFVDSFRNVSNDLAEEKNNNTPHTMMAVRYH